MGWFRNLFNNKQTAMDNVSEKSHQIDEQPNQQKETSGWEAVPAYIEADPADYSLVSLIATAIAAGDQPDSEFVVKKIYQRNPEAKLVSLVAASLAAGALNESQLVVKSISKKTTN